MHVFIDMSPLLGKGSSQNMLIDSQSTIPEGEGTTTTSRAILDFVIVFQNPTTVIGSGNGTGAVAISSAQSYRTKIF